MSLAQMSNHSHHSMHSYSNWQAWANGERQLSSSDLLTEEVPDPAQLRHMYVPMKQASISSSFPAHNENLADEEMVARVVTFFQSVQTNTAIRQLQQDEQDCSFQFINNQGDCQYLPTPALARCPQHRNVDESATASAAAASVVNSEDPTVNQILTELGESSSCFLREQAAIWERLQKSTTIKGDDNNNNNDKKPAADDSVVPIIPEWLHEAAHQEGRQIRVVTVNSTAETRTVMCIGCKKDMLAATNVQLVFCPCCGTTFSPNDLYAFE